MPSVSNVEEKRPVYLSWMLGMLGRVQRWESPLGLAAHHAFAVPKLDQAAYVDSTEPHGT